MLTWLKALLAALSLLTRAPVPDVHLSPDDLRRSVVFYPWVGLGLGAGWALLASPAVIAHIGAGATAAGMLMAMVLMTGGLHVDGLADFADGWFGGQGDRTRTLTIMKDPRIGAHGATALVLTLLLEHAAMTHQLEAGAGPELWLLTPAIARAIAAVAATTLPTARKTGLASSIHSHGNLGLALASLVSAVAFMVVIAPALWPAALAAVACGGLVQAAGVRRCGGTTGDLHGASILIAETAFLLTPG